MPGELPHTSSHAEQAAIAAALKKSKKASKVDQEFLPQPSPTSFLLPSQVRTPLFRFAALPGRPQATAALHASQHILFLAALLSCGHH